MYITLCRPPVWLPLSTPLCAVYVFLITAVKSLSFAFGPCWEPTWSQVSLAINRIKHASADPSRPLPFFDKLRLWLHGCLTMSVQRSTWLLHASLDPYNKTEFMDWTWSSFFLDWNNGISILPKISE